MCEQMTHDFPNKYPLFIGASVEHLLNVVCLTFSAGCQISPFLNVKRIKSRIRAENPWIARCKIGTDLFT